MFPAPLSPRRFPRRTVVLALLAGQLALAGGAAATVVGFDGFANDTLVTTQLSAGSGVTFPDGVVATTTGRARSAPNVAVPLFDGEFARHPFEAQFTSDQSQVIAYVEGEFTTQAISVTLRAYNGSGSQVGSQSASFTGGTGWRSLTVGTPAATPNIRRVVVTATQGSFTTNFLFVDDLTFVRATPPPPPPPTDTTPPNLNILSPGLAAPAFTTPVIPVDVEASESHQLNRVDGRILYVATGEQVGAMDYCGSVASGPCPATYLRETFSVSLSPSYEGAHRIEATACNAVGLCTTRTRDVVVDLPDPPAEVSVDRLEVNQGVQSMLSTLGLPGSSNPYTSGVRLLAGRRTVIRFFPLADGAARNDYTARLHARITYGGGSVVDRFSMPNAGTTNVDVAADPGSAGAREDAYLLMRADESRTLNYVVPASLLENATLLEVMLDEGSTPLTGWSRVALRGGTHLAVKHMRVGGSGVGGGADLATTAEWQNAFRYVEEAYPISVLSVIPAPRVSIGRDDFCLIFSNELSCAVWNFSFYDPPGAVPATGLPTHLMKVGLAPFDSFSRVGVALWGSALAMAYGDAAYAHEIGHTAGRPHAGGAHGEDGGEAWPFSHGSVGPTDFGVITQSLTTPGSFDMGTWDLIVVDPCPGATVAQRQPMCALADDDTTHDFMSYGNGPVNLGPLALTSFANNWVSSHTWNRLYDQIAGSSVLSTRFAASVAAASGGSVAEALLVDGLVDQDGEVHPLPLQRLRVPQSSLTPPPPGPYTLELYGGDGTLLLARSFDVVALHDSGEPVHLLSQLVPYNAALRRVVVKKQGATVLDRAASASPPAVEMVYPDGGEVLGAGVVRVSWLAEDPDGDPVGSRLEYSSDGGATWSTLGSVGSGEPRHLDVDLSELTPSGNARFRVVASDGFLTATDASDCPVAVATASAAACDDPGPDPGPGPGPAPDPPYSTYLTSAAVPGFGFQVRIGGAAQGVAGTPEAACIGETLCVSGALPGRSEVFLRVVGPKPNGKLWPTLVKFSTSDVEVWVRQESTGVIKYYFLAGARPGYDELPGLFDRGGFVPLVAHEGTASRDAWALAVVADAARPAVVRAAAEQVPPLPASPAMTTTALPGFRFWLRLTNNSGEVAVRQEAACIGETLCVSGALPGRAEVFVRVVGPKPNGRLWPTLVRFTTSQVEVWVEQLSTGQRRYYRFEGAGPESSDLTGLFDREGFQP